MDIKSLRYFLTVARTKNITIAAEELHMTQPPLSRQIKEMELELGKKLFIRGQKELTLTEEGVILRKRAKELIELFEKTKNEVMVSNDLISGDVYLGSAETKNIKIIAEAIKNTLTLYPNIKFHLYSGNAIEIKEKIELGTLDFGVLLEPVTLAKLDYLRLPGEDVWGILTRKDNPLAKHNEITPDMLKDVPLLCSRQMLNEKGLSGWLGYDQNNLNIVATFNLIRTPSMMVKEKIGSAFSFDKLVEFSEDDILCFRPLSPQLTCGLYLVWKDNTIISKVSKIFMEQVYALINK